MTRGALSKIICMPRCALVLLTALLSMTAMGAEPYREDAVKAAFLFRFTGYVEWPQQESAQTDFTIAVLGSLAVADELSKLVAKLQVKSLPTHIRVISSPAEAAGAQMLYIGPDYSGELSTAITPLASRPVMIVTDHARGLDQGGTVNFMTIDRRVRFEVSLTAAERSGLKISSQLLSVAARVRGSHISPFEQGCSAWDERGEARGPCRQRVARL